MFSQKMFKCGAVLPDGCRCEEVASVIDADYVYREEFSEGRFEQILDEIRYTMVCPRCGPWTRVETVHVSRGLAEIESAA
jgi:hypothetical protein